MRPGAARMHDPLRNPLVVKVRDLLAKVEVLEQAWSARSGLQGVVGMRDAQTLIRGQVLALRIFAIGIELCRSVRGWRGGCLFERRGGDREIALG